MASYLWWFEICPLALTNKVVSWPSFNDWERSRCSHWKLALSFVFRRMNWNIDKWIIGGYSDALGGEINLNCCGEQFMCLASNDTKYDCEQDALPSRSLCWQETAKVSFKIRAEIWLSFFKICKKHKKIAMVEIAILENAAVYFREVRFQSLKMLVEPLERAMQMEIIQNK